MLLLTIDKGGLVGNIQLLTDAFTVVEDGVFGLTLTKDKCNFYTI